MVNNKRNQDNKTKNYEIQSSYAKKEWSNLLSIFFIFLFVCLLPMHI